MKSYITLNTTLVGFPCVFNEAWRFLFRPLHYNINWEYCCFICRKLNNEWNLIETDLGGNHICCILTNESLFPLEAITYARSSRMSPCHLSRMNKNWAQKCTKNKMHALKWSSWNKVPENIHVKIKFCNKNSQMKRLGLIKMRPQMESKKLNEHTGLNYVNRRSIKLTAASPISKFFPLNLCAFEKRFNRSVYKTNILFWSNF